VQPLFDVIAAAQAELARLLGKALASGPLSAFQYQRYLSMQYHLTRGVQGYFLRAAAHDDLVRKRSLRRFLFDFANEEEQHYLVAAGDLRRMGLPLLDEPLDVTLWHAYFRGIVDDRPFLRLGAACVLENLSGGVAKEAARKALGAPFLTVDNTKFVVLHMHESQPHGDQIAAALADAGLNDTQMNDLVTGGKQGMVLYMRMMTWVLYPTTLVASLDDGHCPPLAPVECAEGASVFAQCVGRGP
jgi:hypothetical protein